jgi:Spy/CpxP family protein refolding chaperone
MNRWIRRAVMSASLAGAVSLVATGVALAQPDAAAGETHTHRDHRHAHQGQKGRLLQEALKLESLTGDQRSAVEQLIAARRAAAAPVRSADAQVLTVLAQEVEQASIDDQALAPSLSAERSAAVAESGVERDSLNRLHSLLTPAQRGELVDRLISQAEGHESKGSHDRAARDGGGRGHAWGGAVGAGAARLNLTPEQKSEIAANLRADRQTWQAWRTDAGQAGQAGQTGPAHHGGGAKAREALDAFRGESFDPAALVHVEHRGERAEHLAKAMVPVLTPAQRAVLGSALRKRAADEA